MHNFFGEQKYGFVDYAKNRDLPASEIARLEELLQKDPTTVKENTHRLPHGGTQQYTLLQIAIMHENTRAIKFLLPLSDLGQVVDSPYGAGENALGFAVTYANNGPWLIDEILTLRPDLLNQPNKRGSLPIHKAACFDKDGPVIQRLIEKKAKVDGDKPSWTPLFQAWHVNNMKGVSTLLENGARMSRGLLKEGKTAHFWSNPVEKNAETLLEKAQQDSAHASLYKEIKSYQKSR